MKWSGGCVLLLIALASLRGDEALLPTGKKLDGSLLLDDGKLVFRAGNKTLPASLLAEVGLPGSVPPFLTARPIHVVFHQGERLTGELLDFDDKNLTLRTAWADRLSIPRPFLEAVEPAGPGLLRLEDFENKLEGWQLDKATRSDGKATSGQHSLKLPATARATWAVPKPLAAGRLVLHVRLPARPDDARARLQLAFGKTSFTIELAGPGKNFGVDTKLAGESLAVPRSPGWHRLEVRFSADYLLAACDGRVFWSSKSSGPGSPLRSLSFQCDDKLAEPVWIDDIVLSRPFEPARHPPTDVRRDEAWLASGDQLLGDVVAIKPDAVTLRLGKRESTLALRELRGLYFRADSAALAPALSGAWARIHLRPGVGAGLDRLVGVVRKLDDRVLTLQHPLLGVVKLERNRIARLEPIWQGRRRELRAGQKIILEKIPARARIEMEPLGAAARPVLAVAWSGILKINGKHIDMLRFTNAAGHLRRDVPAGVLRRGDNVVELVPEHEDSKVLFRILLEVTDP